MMCGYLLHELDVYKKNMRYALIDPAAVVVLWQLRTILFLEDHMTSLLAVMLPGFTLPLSLCSLFVEA